ncbi:MAG: enoyl-CoA hydratase/isomerase family protein [Candidatus Helarchaeota archaeon]
MDFKDILFEEKVPIAIIRINRPKNLNALDLNSANEIKSALEYCAKNEKIRCIVLTGTGRAFSAGGDVKDFKNAIDAGKQDEFIANLSKVLHEIISLIRTIPKPIMSSLNGFAMGAGLNMALACDIILAADTAKLSEAFVNVGLSVDGGGSYIVPKLIGRAKAAEFLFTGDMIDAKEAERIGLINRVIPAAELEDKMIEFATKLAKGPTKAIGTIKKFIEQSYINHFKTQLDLERENQIKISLTEDFKEGVNAFFEKRNPNYKGK